MTIDVKREGTALTLALEGRLDASSTPQAEAVLKENISGVTKLTFDFEKLLYLSSAGLRLLLSAQKAMNQQGEMEILHANETVRDVFAMMGLLDIFTVSP